MKKILKTFGLAAALALTATGAEAVDPLIRCADCSCYVNCGTPCRKPDRTPSACGIGGTLCNASPICFS
jgi:hypothetical protein